MVKTFRGQVFYKANFNKANFYKTTSCRIASRRITPTGRHSMGILSIK